MICRSGEAEKERSRDKRECNSELSRFLGKLNTMGVWSVGNKIYRDVKCV